MVAFIFIFHNLGFEKKKMMMLKPKLILGTNEHSFDYLSQITAYNLEICRHYHVNFQTLQIFNETKISAFRISNFNLHFLELSFAYSFQILLPASPVFNHG